jgi:hypothetical protein
MIQMKNSEVAAGILAVAAVVLMLSPAATNAQTIFTENFNGYVGNQNNTQSNTLLPVAYSGNVTGWSESGAGTMHAVNLNGAGNWAIMFWQDNVITLTTGIAANEDGLDYVVAFDYGTAVYNDLNQMTEAADSLLVEVLRADNSVLVSATFTPGAWGAGNYNLDGGLKGTLEYIGDGTGNVRLRVGPTPPYNSGNFEGEIDNLTVSTASSPTGIIWSDLGTAGMTATSAVASATVNTNLTETVLVWDTSDQGFASTNDWTYRLGLGPTNAGVVSAETTDLASDTEYVWRFYGVNTSINGWSATDTFITELGDDQTPLFTKAEAGISKIALEWQENASHETGYILQRSTAGAGGPYTTLATLSANTFEYTDIPLPVGRYYYRLAATNAVNGSSTRFVDSETNATVVTSALFVEDFNALTGGSVGTQYQTLLGLKAAASLPGWSTSGAGTVHAVDLNGAGDWAIMFYADNVITLTTGIAANGSGTSYEVTFDYGTAVYGAANSDQRTQAGDGLLVEVLRADSSVLASQAFLPGAWDDASNHNLDAGLTATLAYVGDGTGDVRLRIGPDGTLDSGRFEGEIDNLVIGVPSVAGMVFIVR